MPSTVPAHPRDAAYLTAPDTGPDEGRRGRWMQTFTGRRFYPLDPRADDIDPDDIAHSLSMQCRFNGHSKRFYTVAEHSVLVSRFVQPDNALWGLLHDATEAYVGDVVSPLKHHLPDFQAIEQRIALCVAERFGLDPVMPDDVHQVDQRLLLDERNCLLGDPPGDWGVPGEPFGVRVRGWAPHVAYAQFWARFRELTKTPIS